MHLKSLHLINFKNYEEAEIELGQGINCFVGENGSGKTNILDALHYLSMCKSYLNAIDRQNIRFDQQFFVVLACSCLDCFFDSIAGFDTDWAIWAACGVFFGKRRHLHIFQNINQSLV
jgi:energy-coupling factor transporter ATP-binding protein EcfA2